ncbi:acyl carrier protein [Allonocardiopsis opalescens]|uniref:Act minimal PKS acyl carrier protein n=1 Tax=Allonocardiopsis opalescens TaxID=1144618 RepID=A0A2T0Q5N9_9ACTN|nr:acyl carrier protein [Allonocardiopsis opalescens]PRX99102.1 act minimal PKS acyl carrier protein [Allonocardiopsis opalescens]
MSSPMTIDDLRRMLIACAGETRPAALAGDFADRDFEELGYDSLALMETAARIQDAYGVRIPDERVADLRTPRAVLDAVNGAPAASRTTRPGRT